MVFFGIVMILLGIALCALGYLIAFRRKYALINNFVDDKHRGKFDESYARRTGLIEMTGGFLGFVLGIFVLFIRNWSFTIVAFAACVIVLVGGLLCNMVFSVKKS